MHVTTLRYFPDEPQGMACGAFEVNFTVQQVFVDSWGRREFIDHSLLVLLFGQHRFPLLPEGQSARPHCHLVPVGRGALNLRGGVNE